MLVNRQIQYCFSFSFFHSRTRQSQIKTYRIKCQKGESFCTFISYCNLMDFTIFSCHPFVRLPSFIQCCRPLTSPFTQCCREERRQSPPSTTIPFNSWKKAKGLLKKPILHCIKSSSLVDTNQISMKCLRRWNRKDEEMYTYFHDKGVTSHVSVCGIFL